MTDGTHQCCGRSWIDGCACPEPVTTTILGKEYQGRPGMGSTACEIWCMEQNRGRDAAERLLKAKNAIRKVWGFPPHDLQEDMTDIPMEGVQIYPATGGKQ